MVINFVSGSTKIEIKVIGRRRTGSPLKDEGNEKNLNIGCTRSLHNGVRVPILMYERET